MNYKELTFTITSEERYHSDLLINSLSQIGFETFEETDLGFKAYIPDPSFNQDELNQALKDFSTSAVHRIPRSSSRSVLDCSAPLLPDRGPNANGTTSRATGASLCVRRKMIAENF